MRRIADVEKVSIALTPEMAAVVREAVATGEYASASEVMRDALHDWRVRRAQRQQAIDELRRLWDEGLASGPPIDGEQAFATIKAKIDAMSREREG
jgi:antitoxin ParD1/3/4